MRPPLTAKAPDAKAPETKTTDTKPADAPPAATASAPAADAPKAADVKPADAKPADVKQDTAKQAVPDAAKPATDTAKTDTAKPASTVAEADQPVADKLHDLIGAKNSKYFDRKNERTAVENFYSGRSFAPLWTQASQLTDRAKGVIERLKAADKDGLEVADYPVPDFSAAKTPDDLANAELKLTASMLDYARQAQSGRVHWSRVSADIAYPDHPVDPTDVLVNISTARDASAALESYNPPQPLFRALKAKLAELRGDSEKPPAKIDDGPTLKFTPASGKKNKNPAVAPQDARVPTLRVRLGVTENASDDHYDEAVAAAVRKFQNNAGLDATGVLNNQTVKALNSPKRDREIDTVLVNMERWRWLPRNLGEPKLNNAYVILNIPDYTLKVMQGGKQVWTTRVVTGKPGIHATPLLSETMKFITVNPTWNVPPSIVQNEYLPALQQDPTVLERMGLRLETAPRRQRAHLAAAGRRQCARPYPLQLPEQVPGLPARHAGQVPVRQGRARLQPRLHARAVSGSVRRGAARDHRSAGALHGRQDPFDVRVSRGRTSTSRRRSRCTSPIRPRSSTTPASWRSARTSMAATAC